MDINTLYGLKTEIDRIYITGLRLAGNNSKIQKSILIIEKYINEDSAYSELVMALKEVIKPRVKDPVRYLSVISSSLNYLLRLHSEIIVSEEERTEQIPAFSIDEVAVNNPFLELKPLIIALTQQVGNRMEVICMGREKKLFNDFRMYPYLNKALGDDDGEIVECVKDIIKNEIGEKMISFLVNGFECNNKPENLKRFILLYELHYDKLNELLDELLEENASILQVQVLEFLSGDVLYEERIISLCEHPLKMIREIVYNGLAQFDTERSEWKLLELYAKAVHKKNKGELELLSKALVRSKLRFIFDDICIQVSTIYDGFILANKKVDSDAFGMLRSGILILKHKQISEASGLLCDWMIREDYHKIIKKKEKMLAKSAKEVSYSVIDVLKSAGTDVLIASCERIIKEMPESEWKRPFYKAYFVACVDRGDSAERIFETFAPYYHGKYINTIDLAELYLENPNKSAPQNVLNIDKRWIDKLFETLERIDDENHVEALLNLLDALIQVPAERYNQLLILAGQNTRKYLLEITNMIMKRDLPEKYEVVYSLVRQCHDRKDASASNMLRQLPRATYWNEFPEEYAVKFRELKNAPRSIASKIGGN